MAQRIVLIVDPATGAMVDVAGNSRESGRYSKFSRRMLSLHKNPQLDYGVNGGDTLTISKNGSSGKAINLIADLVNVSGGLTIGGRTIEEIVVGGGTQSILERIVGTDGEISVETSVDEETGTLVRKISFDESITSKLEQVFSLVDRFEDKFSEIDSGIDGLDSRTTSAEGNIEQLAETVTGIDERVVSLEDGVPEAVERLDSEIEGLDSRTTSAEGNIEQLAETVIGIDERVVALENGVSDAVERLETAAEDISTLNERQNATDQRVSGISDALEETGETVSILETDVQNCIKKDDLANAISDIEVFEDDTFEDVRGKFITLLERLNALSGSSDDSGEDV